MDWRITDLKTVVRVGSIVPVSPNHFGEEQKKNQYFGIIIWLITCEDKA